MTLANGWAGVAAALATVLATLVLAAWVLETGSGQAVTQTQALNPAPQPAPPGSLSLPLAGNPQALTLAQRSRDLLVGLAATPGGPIDLLAIPGREWIPRGGLRAWVDARPVKPMPCGRACFRLGVSVMDGSPVSILLRVRQPGAPVAAFRFRFPARLPPAGDRLIRAVNRAMGALQTLEVQETLSAGFAPIRTRYLMRAPDRMRFETSRGQKTILIRDKRWDWEAGRWVESPFPGVEAPSYFWSRATNARVIGRARIRGVPVRVLSVFNRRSGLSWFRLLVAPDDRVLKAEMLTESHFMTHRFVAFDEPLEIEAPG